MDKKRCLTIVFLVCVFLAGYFLRSPVWRYSHKNQRVAAKPRGVIDYLGGDSRFINPLLDCEIADAKDILEFRPLAKNLQAVVDQEIGDRHAKKISIYFRALKTGRWVGINENDTYTGASLAKVPLLVAYHKLAESDPKILHRMMTYDGSFNEGTGQNITPSKRLEAGKTYTVSDLLYRMIVYSGNNSAVLLMRGLDESYLEDIFSDLGIPWDRSPEKQLLVSAKTFSSFFRVLYNATYLNRSMSENALHMLSQTEFKDGLVAGVPSDVLVAHKFGENKIIDTQGNVMSADLHDCGIVYHVEHPYLLCVMTQGSSQDALGTVIARISKTAYDFVNSPTYPIVKTP